MKLTLEDRIREHAYFLSQSGGGAGDGVNAGAKLRQPAGVKMHHAGGALLGSGLAARLADLLGRASCQAPEPRSGALQAGAGLDGESAHRAIISDAAMRVLYYADELAFWASGGSRSVDRRIGS